MDFGIDLNKFNVADRVDANDSAFIYRLPSGVNGAAPVRYTVLVVTHGMTLSLTNADHAVCKPESACDRLHTLTSTPMGRPCETRCSVRCVTHGMPLS
jgi:hypothetical protein